jgi:hypothetical protein
VRGDIRHGIGEVADVRRGGCMRWQSIRTDRG